MGAFRSKLLRFGLGAVALAALAALSFSVARETWRDARIEAAVAETIKIAGITQTDDASRDADAVRAFINRNSIHRIDAEFYSYWGDNAEILTRLSRHASGAGAPPHLECSSRAGIMEMLLRHMGYETRSIVVYASADGAVSHTFLEVLNPYTGQWEAQDPDYDVYWSAGSRRAGVFDIVRGDATPCSGRECGWGIASAEGLKIRDTRPYLSLTSIRNAERPLLLNASRAGDLRTFCAAVEKDCRGKIFELR